MQKEKKKSREPIWKLYFNEYAKIWLDTQVKALRPLQYTKPDIAEVENKCLITDIAVVLDVKQRIQPKKWYYVSPAAILKLLYKT